MACFQPVWLFVFLDLSVLRADRYYELEFVTNPFTSFHLSLCNLTRLCSTKEEINKKMYRFYFCVRKCVIKTKKSNAEKRKGLRFRQREEQKSNRTGERAKQMWERWKTDGQRGRDGETGEWRDGGQRSRGGRRGQQWSQPAQAFEVCVSVCVASWCVSVYMIMCQCVCVVSCVHGVRSARVCMCVCVCLISHKS